MNNLILNRDFRLPDDGWYQIAPLGEFPHEAAGIVQVIDAESCLAMAAQFAAEAAGPNFPGLLIDFDHFSLDTTQRSEAAGWIIALEARGDKSGGSVVSDGSGGGGGPAAERGARFGAGLWAQIRWSDVGEEAVKGGRYRFLSPVWARADCVDLGTDPATSRPRMRPVRLLNAAVTNDPNLKGMRPLSNASTRVSAGSGDRLAEGGSVDFSTLSSEANGHEERTMKTVIERLVNHLGLGADATEAAILEKMAVLPTLTVVTELQNSLRDLQTKHDGVVATLKKVEGELVNRHLADFEGVISDGSKAFWSEQLVANRAATLAVLGDLRELAGKETPTPGPSKEGSKDSTRKPLHNRATARPVVPGQGGGTPETDSRAVKIRNRAHEIAKAEGVPFSVAFRRAEKEVIGQ